MKPLHVVARLAGAVCLPQGPIALDALLTWAEAMRQKLPPPTRADECRALPLPIAKSPCGRYWLASFGQYEVEEREVDWTNRRYPVPEAQNMASPKFKRIQITAGLCKSYRIPRERMHLVDDRIDWWCVGDADAVRDLLGLVHYVGKKRLVGLGRVREWAVSECEPWDGFPGLVGGMPTRSLPLDTVGVKTGASRAYARLLPPYWSDAERVDAWVPSWAR